MKIILCGGGTAGHVTPAIAIAESLLETRPDTQILFVGREGGEENLSVTKNGFELKTLKICGFERKISVKNIKNIYVAMSALRKARKLVTEYSPDVVIGTGGYVCWPILKGAQRLKIPTVIHESNASPGLTTKLLSSKCDRVLLNLPGSEKEFKRQDNIRIVGNPVRNDFLTKSRTASRKKLGLRERDIFIFSFGGSGGSERINSSVVALMQSHCTKNPNIRHIHACGRKYFSEIKSSAPKLVSGSNGCIIKPYIDDMATMIAASDIVICRAGAMTIAEISAVGASAILIPSPNVTNNHQYKNAKLICDQNAALMIEESDLNERTLCDAVKKLENDLHLRKNFSENIKGFFVKDSKEKICSEITSLL